MPRLALSLACLVAPSLAGLALLGGPPAEGPVAFKGATIHTAAGPKIDGGVLVVHKGQVVAVGGADTPIPNGAKVIDATGKTIIPGLVDTHSHIGVWARPGVPAHSDGNEG